MQEPSEPDPGLPAEVADGAATRTFPGSDPRSRPPPDDRAAQAPAEVVPPHPPTDVVGQSPGLPAAPTLDRSGPALQHAGHRGLPPEIVRHGPGVPAAPPAGQVELTAQHIWRQTRPAGQSPGRARLGRLSGWALTVALLAVSCVLLYLHFHHPPFRVTGVAITQQTQSACGVDVTGRISTNGSAGTVPYQWLFRGGLQPPQPLSQSVVAGQHAVYVTVGIEGQGHGSASQKVTLQVLGPDTTAASATVAVSCP